MADNIKSIEQDIEDQAAIIKSDMMPEKVKKKAKEIKEDLEKKLKALKMAAERGGEKVKKEAEKEIKELEGGKKKPAAKKKSDDKKDDAPKKKTRKTTKSLPASEFELVIDGKTFKFDNLKSKEECERAMKAVKARYKEHKENKEARAEGREAAKTIPVTRRISDGFVSIAKKAVATVPKTKIDKKPAEIKKELDAVEKAFTTLFDKLEALMGKKIPKSQRGQIMAILNNFEAKVDKGTDKKEKAKAKKKEDGGIVDDSNTWDNDWSYASLMD
jgi:hypothetical protein